MPRHRRVDGAECDPRRAAKVPDVSRSLSCLRDRCRPLDNNRYVCADAAGGRMHLVIVVLCGEADRSPLRSTVDKLHKPITSEIIDEGNHPLLRNVPWRFKVISLQWGYAQ